MTLGFFSFSDLGVIAVFFKLSMVSCVCRSDLRAASLNKTLQF